MNIASNFAAVLLAAAAFVVGPVWADCSLPNPLSTPGAVNPTVNQGNLSATICLSGWARMVRPPRRLTSALKRHQLAAWPSYVGGPMRAYEEDHLIPLELGGAPSDLHNLWPEPRHPVDGWGADRKDALARVLNQLVCSGRLSLAVAQRTIARDWIAAYRQFVIGSGT